MLLHPVRQLMELKEKLDTEQQIQKERLPGHVAIIMDGSGRWANNHNVPRLAGHKQGATSIEQVVDTFVHYGIPYVTLFAFSTENWNRPRDEVEGILKLLEKNLEEGIRIALDRKIKIHHLGSRKGLPAPILHKIDEAAALTAGNTSLNLGLAFNYGSRYEMVDAIRSIVRSGIRADEIDERTIARHLYTADFPDPDLIIRTGGEHRLSNFLLWQAAYTELYFTPVLWPDFDRNELEKAMLEYSRRHRRFGGLQQ